MNTLKKRTGRLAGLALAALLVLPGLASAATYYVSTTGNDAANGLTPATAWKTITHAAATVPAGSAGAPNVISVAAGTYDNTTNGETFPITFTRNYVSLTGAGAATTAIDPEEINTSDALHVDATGFSVSGFTFQNTSDADAIVITEGGFTISNNVFDTTVNDGVSFYRPSETDRTTSISFADMAITNNTFKTRQNGVYVSLEIDFDETVTGLTASFGNFTISGNTFPLTSGDGIYISNLFSPQDITNGTVTAGNLTVTGNTVTGGDSGIYFYSYVYYMENTQVTVGNVVVNNNTCTNQSSYGINLYNWEFQYFYGTTNAVLGNFTVSGNTVQATDYATYPSTEGIYLDYMDYLAELYDETTMTTGSISVTNNTVDVDEYGIYFYSYGVFYIGESGELDSVSVTTGNRTISGNTINSNEYYGLYIDLAYIGYDMYGTSAVNYGNFTISNNTITSDDEALYFEWYEGGIYMYENSSASIGSLTISGNTLTSSNADAFEFYNYYGGYDMYLNSAVTYGPTSITNNTLTAGSGYDGMYFYFYETAYIMNDNASFAMGNFTIDNNTINAPGGDGIYVQYFDYTVGAYLEDNANATLPKWIFTGNTIDVTGGTYGISINYDDTSYSFTGTPTLTTGDIEIGNNTIGPAYTGIDVYLATLSSEASAGVTIGKLNIHDNTLSNISDYGIYVYYHNANNDPGTATLTVGAPTISGNTISGTSTSSGIYLDVVKKTAGITFGMPTIFGNTVSGFDHGIFLEDLAEATLKCNFLENNTLVGMRFNTAGTNFVVNFNSLVGNSVGLSVDDGNAAVINAEKNWWGDKLGPVACASCNGVDPGNAGTVDFTPWLTSQPDKDRCGLEFPWILFVPATTGMGTK